MDLADLRRVGRAAMLVATVGVVVPMVAGFGAMQAIGVDANTALFLGAGITATSVGITARVFADMRALATTEAQTVLGAAVADDVMGLLILTVVTRLSVGGSVSAASVLGVAAIGIGFVAVATGGRLVARAAACSTGSSAARAPRDAHRRGDRVHARVRRPRAGGAGSRRSSERSWPASRSVASRSRRTCAGGSHR